MTLAAKRLSARIGLIAVLHTWGQTLSHHPHVHCLVPGGGVALAGQRWVACKPNFPLSVHALSRTFRRLFLDGLDAAFRRGELGFFGDLTRLADRRRFRQAGARVEPKPLRRLRQAAFRRPRARARLSRPLHASHGQSPTPGSWPPMRRRSRSLTRITGEADARASCASPP